MVERTRIIPKQKPPPDPKNNFERGVNFLKNFYSGIRDAGIETRDAYRKFAEAKKPVQIPGTNTYTIPLDYNQDTLRFIGNKLARGYEETADILQLPFEAAGQLGQYALGFEPTIGSGVGLGDFFYEPSEADLLKIRDQLRPLEYDQAYTIQDDVAFQNYLRGQGYNIPDENFLIDRDILGFDTSIANPDNYSDADLAFINNFMKNQIQNPESSYYVDLNLDMEGEPRMAADGMEPYYRDVETMFDKYLLDQREDFFNRVLEPYFIEQYDQKADILANQLNISPITARGLLEGTGITDMGLLNDLYYNQIQPFDYATKEGEEFYTSPVMDFAGSAAGLVKGFSDFKRLKKIAERNLPGGSRIGSFLDNIYPATFGQGIPAISKRFAGMRPQYRFTSIPRGLFQLGTALTVPGAIMQNRSNNPSDINYDELYEQQFNQ